MKAKIKRYIKKGEEFFLENPKHTVLSLYNHLDFVVIPCCSMSKQDQKELKKGLDEMILKHTSQLTLFNQDEIL